MECGLRHGELCCIMVVSDTGHNEPLYNHEKFKNPERKWGMYLWFWGIEDSHFKLFLCYYEICILFFNLEQIYTWFWKLGHFMPNYVVFTRGKTTDCLLHLRKKNTCSFWYKNVQVWHMRTGLNNLPAPSSFLHLEAVSRGCQWQMAQLRGADAAAPMSHLQGHKSHSDDTGKRWALKILWGLFVCLFLSVFCGSRKWLPC